MSLESSLVTTFTLEIQVNSATVAYAIRGNAAQGNEHLSLPQMMLDLEEDDVVTLVGYAAGGSGEGALGDEFATGATYLTVVGPLAMTVA